MIHAIVALQMLAQSAGERVRREEGATAVEYGLMVGLIAVAIIITVTALGGQLNTLFTRITTALNIPTT